METTTPLIGVIGGIIICLLSLLIAMMWDMKKDLRCTKSSVDGRVKDSDCKANKDKVWQKIEDLQKTVWRGEHE
jgi:hypothetical protein